MKNRYVTEDEIHMACSTQEDVQHCWPLEKQKKQNNNISTRVPEWLKWKKQKSDTLSNSEYAEKVGHTYTVGGSVKYTSMLEKLGSVLVSVALLHWDACGELLRKERRCTQLNFWKLSIHKAWCCHQLSPAEGLLCCVPQCLTSLAEAHRRREIRSQYKKPERKGGDSQRLLKWSTGLGDGRMCPTSRSSQKMPDVCSEQMFWRELFKDNISKYPPIPIIVEKQSTNNKNQL